MYDAETMRKIDEYLKTSFCLEIGDLIEVREKGGENSAFFEVVKIRESKIFSHNDTIILKSAIVGVYRKRRNKFVRVWRKGEKRNLY